MENKDIINLELYNKIFGKPIEYTTKVHDFGLTPQERGRIKNLHTLTESSERDLAWKTLVNGVSHKSSYILRMLNGFKLNKITDTEQITLNSKKFVYERLKDGLFNKILIDGSGGSLYAKEVSDFIVKQVSLIMNSINKFLLLTVNDKTIDDAIKEIDMDMVFDELKYFFDLGDYITSDNVDPYIDKGIRFSKEFNESFDQLKNTTLNSVIKTIKDKV